MALRLQLSIWHRVCLTANATSGTERARSCTTSKRLEGRDVHIVMDNYATHKVPKIKAWLARRPHYHVHFTPDFGVMDQSGRTLVR